MDDCNCDGYASSIYTLTIGSASPSGFRTSYDENCPSTMAVVYTGDAGEGKREPYSHLVTTALFHKCVTQFSGTSCAAPLAAGIFALVLEANPELTWRDMQHLVVQTAKKNDPTGASWSKVSLYDFIGVVLLSFVLFCFAWPCFALLCFALLSVLCSALLRFSVRPQNRQGIEPDPRALTTVFFLSEWRWTFLQSFLWFWRFTRALYDRES